MADLGEVLGTVLASLAHARRIADEQTAAIAEYYAQVPLLSGLSLPRVRVPEMVLELPVVIDSYASGEPGALPPADDMRAKARELMTSIAQEQGVALPAMFLDRFDRELRIEMVRWGLPEGRGGLSYSREALARALDGSFLRAVKQDEVKRFNRDQESHTRAELRRRLGSLLPAPDAKPPAFDVTVLTSDVKERADPRNVMRLRLTLREEGLEWTTVESPDGTVSRTLTPE